MTCINNGSALTDNQIEILSMMIKNKERLGMAICSCDIQRVLDMGTLPPTPTDRPNIKNNSKASNMTVTINVDAKGLSETVRELLVKELRKRIEFV